MFLLPGMVFHLGFEEPVVSSLTESGPKWGPNCADNVAVRGARASYRNISAQLGPNFGLIGTKKGQKPTESHQ